MKKFILILFSLLLNVHLSNVAYSQDTAKEVEISNWHFKTDPYNIGEKENWQNTNEFCNWENVEIPRNWNTQNKYSHYFGKAWYIHQFQAKADWADKDVCLEFGSVYHDSKIWLNGKLLGTSNSGFFPFKFNITDKVLKGKLNTIVVMADNTYKIGAIYNWGGIRRPVKLIIRDKVFIEQQKITPITDLKTAKCNIKVRLINNSAINRDGTMNLQIKYRGLNKELQKAIYNQDIKYSIGANSKKDIECIAKIPARNLHLWHFDFPHLYTSEVRLVKNENVKQIHKDNFGIRKIEVDGLQMKLNGEAVRLCGFNYVPDHRIYGNTLPMEQIKKDIDLMKEAGANMSRLSHLPLPNELLDYLDEKGFLLIDEIPLWGTDRLVDPDNEKPFQWMENLIGLHYNHPCVIGWSIGNEIGRNPKILEYAQKMHKYICDSLDNTRMVMDVSFTAFNKKNDASQLSDIVCINSYSFKGVEKNHNKAYKNIPGKPVFYAEAGTHLLHEDPNLGRMDIHKLVESIRGNEHVIGISLWTFNDYRSQFMSNSESWSTPVTENRPWGLVNVYRQKKRFYYNCREEFAPVKKIEITNDDNVTVKISPREKLDIPAFTLKGYKLHIEIIDNNSWELFKVVDLPVILPGDDIIEIKLKQLNGTSTKGIKVSLINPVGYNVYDRVEYTSFPGEIKVKEFISYKDGFRACFEKDELSAEYIAKVYNEDTSYYTEPTINNFIDAKLNLKKSTDWKIKVYGVNAKGQGKAAQTLHYKSKEKPSPPIIYHIERAYNGFFVGVNSTKFDYMYQIDFADKSGAYDSKPDFQSTLRGCFFVPVPKDSKNPKFRLRLLNQTFVDSEWSEEIQVHDEIGRYNK